MEEFEPGTLGAELDNNPTITAMQARLNATRTQKQQFQSAIPAPRQVSLSSYSEIDRINIEERVQRDYSGLTPEDPAYWEQGN